MPTRSAQAKWEGGLQERTRFIDGQTGPASVQYNFSSRFENGAGSNPEELLAAAEAACFSMALSAALEGNGTPPTSVETTAKCTVEKVGDGSSITRMLGGDGAARCRTSTTPRNISEDRRRDKGGMSRVQGAQGERRSAAERDARGMTGVSGSTP